MLQSVLESHLSFRPEQPGALSSRNESVAGCAAEESLFRLGLCGWINRE